MKTCNKCKGPGPFHKDRTNKDGLSNRCAKCAIQNTKNYAKKCAANPIIIENKKCSKCKSSGPFHKNASTKDGLSTMCKDCYWSTPGRMENRRAGQQKRRKENPEKWKIIGARERAKYSKRRKDNWYSWKYGMEPGDKEKLILDQDGKCQICSCALIFEQSGVDHCHLTGQIRGVLCLPCNRMLGLFKDDIILINRAIKYLSGESEPVPNQFDVSWADPKLASRMRIWQLNNKYQITPEIFSEMLKIQSGGCAICHIELGPGYNSHIDHCHQTGNVRGILCKFCNPGLSQCRDKIELLKIAIIYLGDSVSSHIPPV